MQSAEADTLENVGYRLAPTSHTSKPDQTSGVVVATELLPRELITSVQPNPFARQLLIPKQKDLASERFLSENVRMNVGWGRGNKDILVSASGMRSDPVAYGTFPFGPFVGGAIFNKGVFHSGALYNRPIVGKGIHLGLQSEEGAREDVDRGNTLLEAGFRCALILGFVTVDSNGLMEWIAKRVGPAMFRALNQNLGILIDNGGKVAISTRLQGGSERLVAPAWVRPDEKRVQAEMARSARLFLAEMKLNPSHFSRYLSKDVSKEALAAVLSKISSRKTDKENMGNEELWTYVKFMVNIFADNAVVLDRLVAGGMNPAYFRTLGAGKDIDTALFSMDYEDEEADIDPQLRNYSPHIVAEYLGQTAYTVGEFVHTYLRRTNLIKGFINRARIARELKKSFEERR